MLPRSVNFHINKACNYRCAHCYAVFDDVVAQTGLNMLPKAQQLELVRALDAAGFEKLTLAGGEPTLVPWLHELIASFRGTTMLVTNGSRLTPRALDDLVAAGLDWVVLSIDAATAEGARAIGRQNKRGQAMGAPDHIELARQLHARGLRLKINTVVTRTNLDAQMSRMLAAMKPERWKVLQVLPVDGQNDATIDDLEVTRDEFDGFVNRHREALDELGARAIEIVPEPCEFIRGSYAMVDPSGRFFDSALGCHTYSRAILDVGVEQAFSTVSFDHELYRERGGEYEW